MGFVWVLGVHSAQTEVLVSGTMTPYVILSIGAMAFVFVCILSGAYFFASTNRRNTHGLTLLRSCSALCIVAICLLIYSSGGVHSPFTPFYVMTFTLTLERIAPTTSRWSLLLGFVVPIIAICVYQQYVGGGLINHGKIADFAAGEFNYWATLFGAALSLFVPTASVPIEKFFKG